MDGNCGKFVEIEEEVTNVVVNSSFEVKKDAEEVQHEVDGDNSSVEMPPVITIADFDKPVQNIDAQTETEDVPMESVEENNIVIRSSSVDVDNNNISSGPASRTRSAVLGKNSRYLPNFFARRRPSKSRFIGKKVIKAVNDNFLPGEVVGYSFGRYNVSTFNVLSID